MASQGRRLAKWFLGTDLLAPPSVTGCTGRALAPSLSDPSFLPGGFYACWKPHSSLQIWAGGWGMAQGSETKFRTGIISGEDNAVSSSAMWLCRLGGGAVSPAPGHPFFIPSQPREISEARPGTALRGNPLAALMRTRPPRPHLLGWSRVFIKTTHLVTQPPSPRRPLTSGLVQEADTKARSLCGISLFGFSANAFLALPLGLRLRAVDPDGARTQSPLQERQTREEVFAGRTSLERQPLSWTVKEETCFSEEEEAGWGLGEGIPGGQPGRGGKPCGRSREEAGPEPPLIPVFADCSQACAGSWARPRDR